MKTPFLFIMFLWFTLAGCTDNPGIQSATTQIAPTLTPVQRLDTETPPEPTQPMSILATPQSDSPAAGICDFYPGKFVSFEIFPDIPSPRCARATPEQWLKVINRTGQDIRFWIGNYEFTLQPDQEQLIEVGLGTYLAPGVHVIATTAYNGEGGPELWLTTDP